MLVQETPCCQQEQQEGEGLKVARLVPMEQPAPPAWALRAAWEEQVFLA